MELGILYLFVSLLIFSSAGSAFTLLNNMDASLYMPCNVLCSSNMIGALLLSIFFRNELLAKESYQKITRRTWLWMVLGSVLYSVVGPFLFLTGLASTDVPTASILQRMESINFLVLSYFALYTPVTTWTIANSAMTLTGIILAVVSPLFFGRPLELSSGYLFIIMAGYAFSLSLLISKKYLSTVPVAILAVFRVLLGSVLYHILVIILGNKLGPLYSVQLWIGMLPYGIVYVFLGQTCWLQALQCAPPVYVSVGTTMLFIMSLMWSAILLGVYPTNAQWIGSSVLALSIASSVSEIFYNHKIDKEGEVDDVSINSVNESSHSRSSLIKESIQDTIPEDIPSDVKTKLSSNYLSAANTKQVSAGDFDEYLSQGGGLKGF